MALEVTIEVYAVVLEATEALTEATSHVATAKALNRKSSLAMVSLEAKDFHVTEVLEVIDFHVTVVDLEATDFLVVASTKLIIMSG